MDIFKALIFIGLAVFYLRILGNYGRRNLTAVNVILCWIAFRCDSDLNVEVRYSWVLLLLPALSLILGWRRTKGNRVFTVFLLIFYSIVIRWPYIYKELFPCHNMEEDFGWGVYSNENVAGMLLVAGGLTALLWSLNRKLWKLGGSAGGECLHRGLVHHLRERSSCWRRQIWEGYGMQFCLRPLFWSVR